MIQVEVYDCERRPKSISAIRYIRELRELGLAEAKRLIDDVYYECRSVSFDFDNTISATQFIETMQSFGFQCRFHVADGN